jgi:hypothetical protein
MRRRCSRARVGTFVKLQSLLRAYTHIRINVLLIIILPGSIVIHVRL